MTRAVKWIWAGPGGRREVFAALSPARLHDSERGSIAPHSYRVKRDEIAEALVAATPPPREQVAEQLDDLFLELALAERALKEKGHELPPDVVSAWEEAGAGILKAKRLVEN